MVFNNVHKKTIVDIISFLFIVLFVYAAVSKLLDFESFSIQLAQSTVLSAYAGVIAWSIPGIEIIIAIVLMTTRFRIQALYASFLLMVMFTAYIVIILNFSDFIPCSCGGVLENLSWTQHLIFNAMFIVLAAVALFLIKGQGNKEKMFFLTTLTVMGSGALMLLSVFSEQKMHQNNAFQRIYMPHPIEEINNYPLNSNSYYIAGIYSDKIYLGNYKAPLILEEINVDTGNFKQHKLSISNTTLPYRRVRIAVDSPYFYLGDGTVPIIFRGNLNTGMATPFYNGTYFNHFTIADPDTFGLVTINVRTGNISLGAVQNSNGQLELNMPDNILTSQVDGLFDSDGNLIWNKNHEKFLYVYRYRNTYEVINRNFSHHFSGKTIDTIRNAILDVSYYKSTGQHVLGAKSVVVNRSSATDGDYLYIESDRLGKYDDEDLQQVSTIIDVYNIMNNHYEFSFYIYHERGQHLTDFGISGDLLVAIIDKNILIFKLKPEYFQLRP